MSARLFYVLLGCQPSGDAKTTPHPEQRPPQQPQPAPNPTSTSETSSSAPVLQVCDLVSSSAVTPEHELPAADALSSTIVGELDGLLGYSVAVLPQPDGTARLAAGMPSFFPLVGYTTYYYGTAAKMQSEIWVFDTPLPPGVLDRSMARTILLGDEGFEFFFEGMDLAVGDLTGDGAADLVSGGVGYFSSPYHVIEMPTPAGEHLLDTLAIARREPRVEVGSASVGDWNLDGVGDLAIGGWGGADLEGTLAGWGVRYYGAEVVAGPPQGRSYVGDIPTDGAVAWFDLYDADNGGGPGEIGMSSGLVPDVTGDGASDILVHGYLYGISPTGGATGGFSLFAGNTAGSFDERDALVHLHIPCSSSVPAPVDVGDVTGDGRSDIAIRNPLALFSSGLEQAGAIWLLSDLPDLASAPPVWPISLTDISDALLFGHPDAYLTSIAGFDLDADGQQDLAVLSGAHLYLFRGPLVGRYDIGQADLVVTGAGGDDLAVGDLSGDRIPELVVGALTASDSRGEVRIYDGATILEALP